MAIKDRKELFIRMLSNVTHGSERSVKFFQEVAQLVETPELKEAAEARAFIASQTVATLHQCFRLIGAQPVKPNERLQEVFMEDFRRELNEIQEPAARKLYVLSTINWFVHIRMGELASLVAAADLSGHWGVGALLETVLAEKYAMIERTRKLIRRLVGEKLIERAAA